MNRFRRLISSDIPFARDDANRLLPAMIACLVGFAALLLAASICLTHAIAEQSNAVIGGIQVEVPHAKSDNKPFVDAVVEELKRIPGVLSVDVISEKQMESLLKPWLGDDFALNDLPVPLIVDVKTAVKDGKTAVNLDTVRKVMVKLDAGIKVADRGPWVTHMADAMRLLQGLVMVVALLLLACVLGMIVLVARTNLRLHFKTVSLLHMFGARDDYILKQFQWNSAWLAGRGALTGVAVAALVFGVIVVLSLRLQSPLLPAIQVSFWHVVVLILLPVLTALIALVATRFTVRSMLEHMH